MLGVNEAALSPLDGYVITRAKFVAIQTHLYLLDLSSSHPYQPLVLISTAQCVAGLRSKRTSANVRTLSLGSPSPTSHRAQRECPATQIAWHGCRQHAWAVRAHRDTVILTQHNTSFQGHQFLARCVPHGQPGMPPGMSHARALCTRVAQPWRAWSWRVRRQQWRRTVAPSELGRADRALRVHVTALRNVTASV